MNRCTFTGNMGRDPEVSYTQSGVAKCKFSIAVNEKWKDSNGDRQEHTEWINVVAWRGLAETCGKYLAKGRQVLVEGKMQTRKWQDDNGQDRYMTEIVANTVEFLGNNYGGQNAPRGDQNQDKQGNQRDTKKSPPQQEFDGGGFDNDDDTPF